MRLALQSLLLLLALPCFAEEGQDLLDVARRDARERFSEAARHGAIAKVTPDRRSFYLYWTPQNEPQEDETPPAKSKKDKKKKGAKKEKKAKPKPRPGGKADRLLVTLHGDSRWAVDELSYWRPLALDRNTAILAVQWWFGSGEDLTDYYSSHDLQRTIDQIVKDLGYAPGKVMLHGSNRAARALYELAGLDRTEGRRLYALFFADAGGVDRDMPIIRMMERNGFGRLPLDRTRWALYCGKLDSHPKRDGCPAMARTEKWIDKLGGEVNLVIEDAEAGSGGFYQDRDHIASVLDLFGRLVPGEPVIVMPKQRKVKPRKPKAKPKPEPTPEPEAEPKPEPQAEPETAAQPPAQPPAQIQPPAQGQPPAAGQRPASGPPPAQETAASAALPTTPKPGGPPPRPGGPPSPGSPAAESSGKAQIAPAQKPPPNKAIGPAEPGPAPSEE